MRTGTTMDDEGLAAAKRELRRAASAARDAVRDRAAAATAACAHLSALAPYRSAQVVLWYASMPSELATSPAIEAALAEGKRVAVPWCDGDDLGLWRLESVSELEPGTWGIPEPPPSRRGETERLVAPEAIELVVVPGLAFDRRGRRLGHGKGYYDRLLARSSAVRAGLCYEAQLFPNVPAGPRDAVMDWLVTERGARPTERISGGSEC